MTPELAILKTVVMCVQTIVLAAVCFMIIKFLRDGRIEAERENKRKRETLDQIFRAMEAERDFVLDDIQRQAEEILRANRK